MEIKASQVKELRELSGVGMMECKKALVEVEGDIEKLWIFFVPTVLSRLKRNRLVWQQMA